jgi:steroid 5-alpha reductase family enzyme
MSFVHIWFQALAVIIILMTFLWIISIIIKNVSIVDLFWGLGFVIINAFYFAGTEGDELRKYMLLVLVSVWGIRLSAYLSWRNIGKGEDFRYREFRKKYGERRYWWISYFQTFLLQGVLMWLISATLLGANYNADGGGFGIPDMAGLLVWLVGFFFETAGDYQLARFRSDPQNKGRVLDTGLWKYTRHPNYFGDSAVWWGYGLICISAGSYLPAAGALLMTALIIKVSGVVLLEKSLQAQKPGYREYAARTSPFIPWFPRK